MLDSHCHFDASRFDPDRDACEERARAVGVDRVLVPGVSEDQWATLRQEAPRRGWLFALGTHPRVLPTSLAVPRDLSGACAIGECGLDRGVPVAMDVQERVLEAHLAVAREAGLPVLLHCVRAHDRLVPLLRRWGPVRGVLHSYSGGAELVREYLALGLHFSFAGVITHDNARKPLHALQRVPRERLLVETDAPDQCPRPRHGRNEPAFLPLVVAAMERVRGEPLRDQLEENARSLGW